MDMPRDLIRLIFVGTNQFAAPILKSLMADGQIEILTVITQPDAKAGRNQELATSPVKDLCFKNNLPCLQPEKIKDSTEIIKGLKPEVVIVADYGQMIPDEILKIPKYGCLNIHPSLLPMYRGASPIQSALLNGDTETGISIIVMNKSLDSGSVLWIRRENIFIHDTAETLRDRLALIAGLLLLDVLPQWTKGLLTPRPQNENKATYCRQFLRTDGQIKWLEKTAEEIYNQWRAFTPWPGCFTFWQGKRLKIVKLIDSAENTLGEPGKVVKLSDGVGVLAKSGVLQLLELQLEGKKSLPINDFARGYPQLINSRLE